MYKQQLRKLLNENEMFKTIILLYIDVQTIIVLRENTTPKALSLRNVA